MSNKPNNNGGYNSFYDIPDWVKNVDDLNEYIQATGPMSNVMKSLFGMNKSRHSGTSPDRDSKKIVHYGVRILLWLARPKNENIQDVDILIQLYNELPEYKQKRFEAAVNHKKSIVLEDDEEVGIPENETTPPLTAEEVSDTLNKVYTETETGIDYVIHHYTDDYSGVILMQEGYTRGNTETYTLSEFRAKFELKI